MPRLSPLPLFILPLALSLAACTQEEEPANTDDPDAVIAQAVDFESNFERLDANGVVTEHDEEGVNVARFWANSIGAEVFRTLDPDNPDPDLVMPEGAIFLKESYDAEGNPLPNMQVMAKFSEGYHDLGRDWFFAMITREGEVVEGRIGNGPEVTGCVDCHDGAVGQTDLIIGLPAEELAP